MAKKPTHSIPIDQLRTGMFVADIDINWINSPFLTHSRRIKSAKDIALLHKAGVKVVTIDLDKSRDPVDVGLNEHEGQSQKATDKTAADQTPKANTTQELEPPQESPDTKNNAQAKETQLQQEVDLALEVRQHAKRAILNLHEELNNGGDFSQDEVRPLIEETLSSLERYHHALFNLVHVSKRNQKVADHTFGTMCLALCLAKKLKFSKEDIEALGIAALIHEAGWAQIPKNLMGKRTPYTRSELKLIQQHSLTAVKAIKRCDIPNICSRIVAEHHELCDGSGYPNHLTALNIHPLSKLFSAVDSYDELVNQLSDQPGMLPSNALRHLYLQAREHRYDSRCVFHLIKMLGVYPVSSALELSDGTCGIVREVPPDNALAPLIEIRINAQNQVLKTPYYVDLSRNNSLSESVTITQVIDPTKSKEPHHRRLLLDL